MDVEGRGAGAPGGTPGGHNREAVAAARAARAAPELGRWHGRTPVAAECPAACVRTGGAGECCWKWGALACWQWHLSSAQTAAQAASRATHDWQQAAVQVRARGVPPMWRPGLPDADFEAAGAAAGAERLAQVVVRVLRSEVQQVAVQPSTPAVHVGSGGANGTEASVGQGAAAAMLAGKAVSGRRQSQHACRPQRRGEGACRWLWRSLEAVRFPALHSGTSWAALALPLAHSPLAVVAAGYPPALILQQQ